MDQINRDVFNNASLSYCYRILRKLGKLNYLEKNYIRQDNHKPKSTYSISNKAFKEIILNNGQLDLQASFKPHDNLHELALVDIRYCFKRCNAVESYLTENYISSGLGLQLDEDATSICKLNPDALVELKSKGKSYFYAVEYELSRKHIERIKKKLRQYYINEESTGVFYICKDESLRKYLVSIDNKYFNKHSPKVFYALLEDVINSNDGLTFYNRDNAKLSIK